MKGFSEKKIRELRARLNSENIDSAVFLCTESLFDPNIGYLTGLQLQRASSFAALIVSQKKSFLAVTPLEYEQAQSEANADKIIKLSGAGSLKAFFKENLTKGAEIGVNGKNISFSASKLLPKGRKRELSGICSKMREIKEPEEIELIRKACKIADRGAKYLFEALSPNLTERELALGIENEMRRFGADEPSFPTILTSGKRSSLIHPSPGFLGKKIKRGLGLADFGARYRGYCSDITVPFAMGKLSAKEEKIARAVEKAYEKTIRLAEYGVPTWKLHKAAQDSIWESGFRLEYAIGHGIGLDLHDSPLIGPKPKKIPKNWAETKLAEGMAFTIEPGVHVPGVGGWRIENDFLMERGGLKKLTNAKPIFI